MKASEAAFRLIKKYEGFRSQAYKCPADVWTIGWGHTRGVKEGDTCTNTQAEAWLHNDVASSERIINATVLVPLTQNQFDALVSFTYNTGHVGPTMLRLLNQGEYGAAGAEFPKWIYGGNRQLQGLIHRRADERALFDGEVWRFD